MEALILIPALLAVAALGRWPLRTVFLNVYLPVLILTPQYYFARVAHLPPIAMAEAAMLPLFAAMIVVALRGWQMRVMDLLVLLFSVSIAIGETMQTKLATGGLVFFDDLLMVVAPYMVGRMLIETGTRGEAEIRRPLLRRLVLMLAVIGLISVRDFVTGTNSWQIVGHILWPAQDAGWPMQMRWGFGRIAGPFGHAILAGMIFLMGATYCLWLMRADAGWGSRQIMGGLPLSPRGLVLGGIVLGLLMTQSRGPWIGVLLALLFIWLMQNFTLRTALVLFLSAAGVFGAAGYVVGDSYTNVQLTANVAEEQASAVYRRQLFDSYMPVIAQRPVFGWGVTAFPSQNGQTSIDNQYLWVAVTRGLVGLGLFLTIALSSMRRLIRLLMRPMRVEDRQLVFAHMAVFLGLLMSLTTVYLGEQVVVLLFMLVGWTQALDPPLVEGGAVSVLGERRLIFQRVLQ